MGPIISRNYFFGFRLEQIVSVRSKTAQKKENDVEYYIHSKKYFVESIACRKINIFKEKGRVVLQLLLLLNQICCWYLNKKINRRACIHTSVQSLNSRSHMTRTFHVIVTIILDTCPP